MSRHKLVKTMDLDDELDDFDGANYDNDLDAVDELTTEDKGSPDMSGSSLCADESASKARLRECLAEVRAVLGPSAAVSDKDIEDSLWHYYYDTGKTINYILQQQAPSQPKKPVKNAKDSTNEISKAGSFDALTQQDKHWPWEPFLTAVFFTDAPWLNIPIERKGEILIESLHSRGGLLGGSSGQGGTKLSKLAALAAARKKKENERQKSTESQESNSSVAILEKLKHTARDEEITGMKDPIGHKQEVHLPVSDSAKQVGKYANARRRGLDPIKPRNEPPTRDLSSPSDVEDLAQNAVAQLPPTADPSTFAKVMFGSPQPPEPSLAESFQNLTLSLPQVFGTDTKLDPFIGPSPDDVVTKAQNSSKGAKAPKKSSQPPRDDKSSSDLSQSVAEVTIREKPKSRNLDVLAEFHKSEAKHAVNFVVIGHVDAGKSTLMGRLLYDLNVVDQRTIDKYRKEAERIGKSSFALAWVLDQGTEERSRGVTIDIAMNKFETSKTSFTILDAPGHRDFIPNMIAGASQADFATLVIDASTGSFESGLKGQTKEHALLVRSMGVQRIVVAVNKLDTVQWEKDRYDEIRQQISAFLTTAGFQPKNIAFVPCSGLTGDNIARRATDPKASWYDGPILIEQLEASDPATRALDKPLRITIADIFRGGVQNPLSISGRLESGTVQVGDRVVAMPANETATIKGIEVDSEPTDWAVAGQNVALHLTDIEQKYLKSGDVICPPSAPIKNISSFLVKILAFDHVTPMHIEVHRGRLQVPGRISQLVAVLDKGTGAVAGKKKPRLIQPGAVARLLVEVETPVPLEAPGRVILRAGGETVAAGLLE
ncbi:MAG: hypothetical protein Q9170_004062 [Blastenia crenularia]